MKKFLQTESLAGILLIVFAAIAMIVKNSDLSALYQNFLMMTVEIRADAFSINKPLLLWINDGIMAIFFFVVGLELKRELLVGKLKDRKTLLLPAIAALGGIVFPALIYLAFNIDNNLSAHGWAIPTATDIAFALGVLALLGSRVPTSLKLFLMTLAIIDDVAGILIIAFFYSNEISFSALMASTLGFVGLFILNRLNVKRIAPYLLFGIFIWVCFLKSGVHATIAGVINAFFIPIYSDSEQHDENSPLDHLLHNLHPYIALGVLPIFAFANAGVDLSQVKFNNAFTDIPVGIFLGLFVGKQLGVFAFSFAAIKLKLSCLPERASWLQLYGTSVLCGIGFTMSLFIASLAFEHGGAGEARIDRLAILLGSIASAIVGYLILFFNRVDTSNSS
nr:Na+/H+ antiporter NhaA [Aliikangiella sp. G2MR2-5]